MIRPRVLKEGVWVSVGQIVSALGGLVAVRLLTEFLEPDVFGFATLLLGIVAFGQSLVVYPIMQAVQRFYPNETRLTSAEMLRAVSRKILQNCAAAFAVATLLIGLLYSAVSAQSMWLGIFIAGLFTVDTIRSFETSLLNAARRQSVLALWSVAEAWLRPLAAICAIAALGAEATSMLFGFIVGSIIPIVLFYQTFELKGVRRDHNHGEGSNAGALTNKLWVYAIPLIPIAGTSWLTSMADRYLIAGVLGVAEVGVYAAAYALISRPFIILGGILDQTLRPIYYQALATKDSMRARTVLHGWIGLSVVGGGIGFVLTWLLKDEIAYLLLAEPYRRAAKLMPWIALGYWLIVISHVFTRICYAYHDTKAVLWTEIGGATLCIATLVPFIYLFGVAGAAMAVPIYFGAQLGLSIIFARRVGWRWYAALSAR